MSERFVVIALYAVAAAVVFGLGKLHTFRRRQVSRATVLRHCATPKMESRKP